MATYSIEEDNITISSQTPWQKTTKEQREYFKNKTICDIQIVCKNGERIFAHRCVLAASSNVFKKAFESNPFSLSNIIGIDEYERELVDALFHYTYNGWTTFSKKHASRMLSLAKFLMVKDLAIELLKYLCEEITKPSAINICINIINCIWNHRVLKEYKDLYEKAMKLAKSEFLVVIKGSDFLEMRSEALMELIKKDDLGIEKEDEVLDALLKWYNKDKVNREKEFKDLLVELRWRFLSDESIKKLRANNISDQSYLDNPRIKKEPRKQSYEHLLIINPTNSENKIIVNNYHEIDKKWCSLFKVNIPQKAKPICSEGLPHKTFVLDTSLIILTETKILEKDADVSLLICELDGKDTKMKTEYLKCNQKDFGATAFQGFIYFVGGMKTNDVTNQFKVIPTVKYWKLGGAIRETTPMMTPRSHASAAGKDGMLYVVGGMDDSRYLSTVEYYDSSTEQWHRCTSMNTARIDFGLVLLNNKLYAIGGKIGDAKRPEITATVECYDPQTEIWTKISSLNLKRHSMSCAVRGNRILVIGGIDDYDFVLVTEEYNPDFNEWTKQNPLLEIGLTSCVLTPTYLVNHLLSKNKTNKGYKEMYVD